MFRFACIVSEQPAAQTVAQLSAMLETMTRGPADAISIRRFPALGCCLGWISTNEAGGEADSTILETRQAVLLVAGEHFASRGPVRPQTDRRSALTQLAADRRNRRRILRELNGWFAGVLVDVEAGTIALFNDRFGLRRVYYSRNSHAFACATEAKAVLAVQAGAPVFSPEALGEFVAGGSVTNNRTLFQDVLVLPPASDWSISRPAAIAADAYFSAEEWEHQPSLSGPELYARLRDTLTRVIPRYLSGSPLPAISLTGGIDTRLIMAFGGADRPELSTYTYGGMYRDCRDVQIAGRVARACGHRHGVLRLDDEFLTGFSRYAEETVRLTDGTLDIAGAHEVFFSRQARAVSPIRVTGNYGSEILRGVTTLKPLGLAEDLFAPALVPYIREGTRRIAEVKRGNPLTCSAFREMPWHLFGRLNAGQSQLVVRSPYTDNELVELAYQAPPEERTNARLWNRLIAERNPSLASIPTDMGRVVNRPSVITLPNRLLQYGLFKAEWYYEGGMPHRLAWIDRCLRRDHPLPFVAGSHKIEHYRRWFREELFEYVAAVLRDPSGETPWVNTARASDVLVRHREGRGNFLAEINRLATIALIQRLLMARRRDRRPYEAPVTVRGAGLQLEAAAQPTLSGDVDAHVN